MKRFTITAIKKDGLRHLAFDNNHHNTFETKEDAETQLSAVINNNEPERVADLVGKDLEVTEVECYPGGDATRTIF